MMPTTPEAPCRKWLRRLLPLGGMFKGGQVNANDLWSSLPVSPDEYITQRLPVLVARMREQWSNNDHVKRFVDLCRRNTVGPRGILLQAQVKRLRGGQLDTDTNDAIEAWWHEWGRKGHCEVTGKLSWREIQALCVETCARDGEFIARKITGESVGPFGFALQLIDPLRLPVRYQMFKTAHDAGFVRQGIEFNRFGKPLAYHFSSIDERDAYYYSINGRGYVRVPADEVIHVFKPVMVGQRRGLPWAATSLMRLHHLQGFEDAAVQNARASATKMGFITYKEGFGPQCEDDEDVAATIDAEPLSFHELPEGAELADWDPNYPSGEFAAFTKAMKQGIAAGMDVSYHALSGDLVDVNFSSIRQGALDERERWKEDQQFLIESLCGPVFEDALKVALLAGHIRVRGKPLPAENYDLYRRVSWQGRRWAWVDPRADVDSVLSSIHGGLTSISQVIREQGRDPQEVFREIAEDLREMETCGIHADYLKFLLYGPKVAAAVQTPETESGL
ncbi:MAG TPA: phage portal protein [Xylella taiwanensis]